MIQPLPKILIADDEEANLQYFEQVLRLENFGVAKARDGLEALARFEQYQPDLVLLDVAMPRLDGFQVCSQLKRNPRAKGIPILMVTGIEDREARLNAFQMGANDYLLKPIESVELLTRVRSLLHLRRCHQCGDRHEAVLAGARIELTAIRHLVEQAAARLPASPNPEITPLLIEAVGACKRLDQTLTTV